MCNLERRLYGVKRNWKEWQVAIVCSETCQALIKAQMGYWPCNFIAVNGVEIERWVFQL